MRGNKNKSERRGAVRSGYRRREGECSLAKYTHGFVDQTGESGRSGAE